MADHMPMRAPAHYLRVNLDDAAEAEYWQVVLDATRNQIEDAITAVGRDAMDVRTWLGESWKADALRYGGSR